MERDRHRQGLMYLSGHTVDWRQGGKAKENSEKILSSDGVENYHYIEMRLSYVDQASQSQQPSKTLLNRGRWGSLRD